MACDVGFRFRVRAVPSARRATVLLGQAREDATPPLTPRKGRVPSVSYDEIQKCRLRGKSRSAPLRRGPRP